MVRGKGWSVLPNPPRTKNSTNRFIATVVLPDGKRISAGARDTKQEAAVLAVAAARHYGTLNWAQTVRWFKIMGYELDGSDTLHYERTPKEKGWYVRRDVTAAGTVRWVAFIGFDAKAGRKVDRRDEHSLKFVCARMSRELAAKHAVIAAKATPLYNEAATRLWLQRNNMKSLIALA